MDGVTILLQSGDSRDLQYLLLSNTDEFFVCACEITMWNDRLQTPKFWNVHLLPPLIQRDTYYCFYHVNWNSPEESSAKSKSSVLPVIKFWLNPVSTCTLFHLQSCECSHLSQWDYSCSKLTISTSACRTEGRKKHLWLTGCYCLMHIPIHKNVMSNFGNCFTKLSIIATSNLWKKHIQTIQDSFYPQRNFYALPTSSNTILMELTL